MTTPEKRQFQELEEEQENAKDVLAMAVVILQGWPITNDKEGDIDENSVMIMCRNPTMTMSNMKTEIENDEGMRRKQQSSKAAATIHCRIQGHDMAFKGTQNKAKKTRVKDIDGYKEGKLYFVVTPTGIKPEWGPDGPVREVVNISSPSKGSSPKKRKTNQELYSPDHHPLVHPSPCHPTPHYT